MRRLFVTDFTYEEEDGYSCQMRDEFATLEDAKAHLVIIMRYSKRFGRTIVRPAYGSSWDIQELHSGRGGKFYPSGAWLYGGNHRWEYSDYHIEGAYEEARKRALLEYRNSRMLAKEGKDWGG